MATRTKRRASRPGEVVVDQAGPFLGVNDSQDPYGADWTKYASDAVNYWKSPRSGASETYLERRWGKLDLTSASTGRTGLCQCIFQWEKSDGTSQTLGIFATSGANSEIVNMGTGAVVTPTVTVIASSSNTVYAVCFGDNVIINDGQHAPFVWDGTGGSAGTAINFNVGTGLAYGAPWVYNAQVFFIRADIRTMIVWSDVNLPLLGYAQANYTNTWQLTQTSAAPLCAGVGTNNEMYLFRPSSITRIAGDQNSNYQTTGTFEGVSEHVGSPVPWCQVRVDQSVYFLDAYARLHVIEPGPRVRDVYSPATHTLSQGQCVLGDGLATASAIPCYQLVYWGGMDLLIHQMPNASSYPTYAMVWARSDESYCGRWCDGGTFAFNRGLASTARADTWRCIGVDTFQGGRRLIMSTATTYKSYQINQPTDGASYAIRDPETTDTVARPCANLLETGWLHFDPITERIFNALHIEVQAYANYAGSTAVADDFTFWVEYQTSRHANAWNYVQVPHSPTQANTHLIPLRMRYGLSARGRFIRIRLDNAQGTATTTGNPQPQFRPVVIRVEGVQSGMGDEGQAASFWSSW